MNVQEMRAWIKKRYSHLNGRNGRVPVEKCPDAQIIATYYSMSNREIATAASKNVSRVNKNKQHVFNF
jgi:hypothetical protein